MKRKIARSLILVMILGGMSLSACAGSDDSANIDSSNEVKDESQNTETPEIQQTEVQEPDTALQSGNNMPSTSLGLNVAVIDEKRANITVHANGGEYFGYSIQMFDPGLGEISSGNYYDVKMDASDGSGYSCHLMGYRDWNVDYIASDDVPFEDYGQGDYLFRVTLPESDIISFYTIDTYRLNCRTSKNDTTFYSAGDFSYSDVCQFMDEDAAKAARENEAGDYKKTNMPSQEDMERISEVLKCFAGSSYSKTIKESVYKEGELITPGDKRSIGITGDYGTFQFWPSMRTFDDKFEIHLYSEKKDLGDDNYHVYATIDANDVVTIECEGHEGSYAEGSSIILVFDADSITIESGDMTQTFTDEDMIN